MPVHAFLKGGQAVLMVQKHEKSSFLAEVRQSPEGQHDRSQARSAWSREENSPVPAGRLNGSRLRLDANIPFNRDT